MFHLVSFYCFQSMVSSRRRSSRIASVPHPALNVENATRNEVTTLFIHVVFTKQI
jgi:hypothetical protein